MVTKDVLINSIRQHIRSIDDDNVGRYNARIKAYNNIISIINNIKGNINESIINSLDITPHMKIKLIGLIKNPPNPSLIHELAKIHGIGMQRAKELAKKISSVQELYNIMNDLPLETQLWLKYKPLELIPRELIDEFKKKLKIKATLAGSYRRGKPYSHDIDLIVVSDLNMKDIVKKIGKIYVYSIGDDKASGLIKVQWDGKYHYVKLDIMKTTEVDYPYFLLYLTGSREHNIYMRQEAKKKNMLLNQTGLYKRPNMVKLKAKTEEDIFKHLSIKYKNPRLR